MSPWTDRQAMDTVVRQVLEARADRGGPGETMTAAFLPQDLIRRKRDGLALSPAEIDFLVQGMVDQTVSEGQLAAFAMAVYFRGLKPG